MSDDLDELIAEQSRDPRFAAALSDAGDRSRLLRELTALSQRHALSAEEIAERMGVDPSEVRAYERGETDPCLSFHQRYARAVGARVRVEIEETAAVS